MADHDDGGYDTYPSHPLYGVPANILTAGREVMESAARRSDVNPEMAHALADAVLTSALPAIRTWLHAEPQVWRVFIRLDDGEEFNGIVMSRTAADAGVVMGNWVRARRGVPEDGDVGIQTVEVRHVRGERVLEEIIDADR